MIPSSGVHQNSEEPDKKHLLRKYSINISCDGSPRSDTGLPTNYKALFMTGLVNTSIKKKVHLRPQYCK